MKYKIACDLDGCLADFEKGVFDIFNKNPDQIELKTMWRTLASQPDGFFNNLDWMPDGKELWNYIKKYNPTVLTGVPFGNWAPKQKRIWCGIHLGWDVPVITCFASEKAEKFKEITEEDETMLLIDDRLKAKSIWEAAGGIFVHHTNTSNTIKLLKELGL